MNRTVYWVLCAFFAALTAVLAQIALTVGAIPFSLATLAVFLTGALLGGKYGALSQCLYLLIGLCGMPVFANFRGGVDVLLGPTGGYIVGYVLAAFATGWIAEKGGNRAPFLALGMVAGMVSYYLLGTAWFMKSTSSGLLPALTACVFPFVPIDLVKIAAATFLARRLHPILRRTISLRSCIEPKER